MSWTRGSNVKYLQEADFYIVFLECLDNSPENSDWILLKCLYKYLKIRVNSSPCVIIRFAGQSLGSANTATVIHTLQEVTVWPLAAVGAGVVHPDPVHRAPALGETIHGGHPLSVWEVAMGVSDQRAGVTILTFNNVG